MRARQLGSQSPRLDCAKSTCCMSTGGYHTYSGSLHDSSFRRAAKSSTSSSARESDSVSTVAAVRIYTCVCPPRAGTQCDNVCPTVLALCPTINSASSRAGRLFLYAAAAHYAFKTAKSKKKETQRRTLKGLFAAVYNYARESKDAASQPEDN